MSTPVPRLPMLVILLLLLGAAVPVRAQVDLHRITGHAGPLARLEQIGGDLREAFDGAVERYAGEIRARPYDVVARIDRCRFIEQFAYTYEYVAWVDDAFAQSEQCAAELDEELAEHPEVELFRLERLYGETRLDAGVEIAARLPSPAWTPGQSARLFEALAGAAEQIGDERAGGFALRALELDSGADVRLIAAGALIERGDDARAVEVLTSPFDTQGTSDPWYVIGKMQLLAAVGQHERVAELYHVLTAEAETYSAIDAARALRDSGRIELARREYERAGRYEDYLNDTEQERFAFELEYGSPEQALAAYDAWRDRGWSVDPLGVNRVTLLLAHPALPWRVRDVLGLLGGAAALAAVASLALLPVAAVHYRGLARRAAGLGPHAPDGWQLRHAWYGLAVAGCASILAMYGNGPLTLVGAGPSIWGVEAATPEQVAWMSVADAMLLVLLLLPLGRIATARQPAWLGANWSVPESMFYGLVGALVFRIPLLLVWLAVPDPLSLPVPDGLLWEALGSVRDEFGIATAYWLIVVMAPVMEEFLFRGVVLRAFSNHVAFGWANVAQAALFALAHADAPAMPYLFVFGLAAGYMARRSGGLLAPMIMHAMFNAPAVLLLLA